MLFYTVHLYEELLRVPSIIHYPKSIDIGITKAKGVVSTTRIYDIIVGIATGKVHSDEVLYSGVVSRRAGAFITI